jgi:hypothetical protein
MTVWFINLGFSYVHCLNGKSNKWDFSTKVTNNIAASTTGTVEGIGASRQDNNAKKYTETTGIVQESNATSATDNASTVSLKDAADEFKHDLCTIR